MSNANEDVWPGVKCYYLTRRERFYLQEGNF